MKYSEFKSKYYDSVRPFMQHLESADMKLSFDQKAIDTYIKANPCLEKPVKNILALFQIIGWQEFYKACGVLGEKILARVGSSKLTSIVITKTPSSTVSSLTSSSRMFMVLVLIHLIETKSHLTPLKQYIREIVFIQGEKTTLSSDTASILLIDDGAYSGDQLRQNIDFIEKAYPKKSILVAVPYISDIAKFYLTLPRKSPVELLYVTCIPGLFAKMGTNLNRFQKYDLLYRYRSSVCSLLEDFFEINPRHCSFIFSHKIADNVSIPHSFLLKAPSLSWYNQVNTLNVLNGGHIPYTEWLYNVKGRIKSFQSPTNRVNKVFTCVPFIHCENSLRCDNAKLENSCITKIYARFANNFKSLLPRTGFSLWGRA